MTHSFLTKRYRLNLACVLALAIIVGLCGVFVEKSFYLTMMIYTGIYAIAALGMFVLFGCAGQISIGQSAFFGLGAYATAYLAAKAGWPSLVVVLASVSLCAAFGLLVSRPLLRLSANYLAMGTLAFGAICFIFFVQWRSITGGLDPGIIAVPPFDLYGHALTGARQMYWLVCVCLCLAMWGVLNILHSRIGRALRALNGSEVGSSGIGVDVVRYKVGAFTLAAAMSGLAGSLFAFYQSSFNASSFNVDLSIELLVMVVVGSVASPWGALAGALFVTVLPIALEDFEQYKLLIYGLILTVVMIFLPDGVGRALVDLIVGATRRRSHDAGR